MTDQPDLPGIPPVEERDGDDGKPGALERARAVLRRLAVEQPQSLRAAACARARALHQRKATATEPEGWPTLPVT